MHEVDIGKFKSNFVSVVSDKGLVLKSNKELEKGQSEDNEVEEVDIQIEYVRTNELQTLGENMRTERGMI